tara:strand:+ start:1356 stop:1601 length:246 start_codon:yes stop_codon:yes gene_type:complete
MLFKRCRRSSFDVNLLDFVSWEFILLEKFVFASDIDIIVQSFVRDNKHRALIDLPVNYLCLVFWDRDHSISGWLGRNISSS